MNEIYKSGQTKIYENETKYIIKNESGVSAYFDKDKRIFEAVKLFMGDTRSFYYNPLSENFYVNIGNKYVCNLRQVVIAATLGGDFFENLKEVKQGQIKLVNPEETNNYCRENLEYSRQCGNNSLNTFWSDGKYFYIKHNPTGVVARTDWYEPLNDILKSKRWYYSKRHKMMRTTKQSNKTEFIPLYRFVAFFQFYSGNVDFENWYETCSKLLGKGDFCVDHLDTDTLNCTMENLQIVTRSQNTSKANLTMKCNQAPFKCSAMAAGNRIILIAGYENEIKIQAQTSFTDIDSFIVALKDFYKSGIIMDDYNGKILLPYSPRDYFKTDKY